MTTSLVNPFPGARVQHELALPETQPLPWNRPSHHRIHQREPEAGMLPLRGGRVAAGLVGQVGWVAVAGSELPQAWIKTSQRGWPLSHS